MKFRTLLTLSLIATSTACSETVPEEEPDSLGSIEMTKDDAVQRFPLTLEPGTQRAMTFDSDEALEIQLRPAHDDAPALEVRVEDSLNGPYRSGSASDPTVQIPEPFGSTQRWLVVRNEDDSRSWRGEIHFQKPVWIGACERFERNPNNQAARPEFHCTTVLDGLMDHRSERDVIEADVCIGVGLDGERDFYRVQGSLLYESRDGDGPQEDMMFDTFYTDAADNTRADSDDHELRLHEDWHFQGVVFDRHITTDYVFDKSDQTLTFEKKSSALLGLQREFDYSALMQCESLR